MTAFTRLLLLTGLVLGYSARAQNPQSFTLEQAQAYAVEHAFDVLNARYEAEVASREVKETTAQGLPQINGTIEYNNYIDIPVQVAQGDVFGLPMFLNEFLGGVSAATGVPINAPPSDPDAISEFQFGADQTATGGIQATQLIFDGSYFVGLKASRSYAEAMSQGVRKSEADVKRSVAEAYHLALLADENVGILRASLELVQNSFEETQKLYEAGFLEALDVDQLQLSVSDIESRLRYAELQQGAALDYLKFTMGMPLNADIALTSEVESLLANVDPALLQNSFDPTLLPEYKVQRSYVELAGLGVKLEKARRMPSISAFYTNQRNAQRFEFDFFDSNGRWYPIQLWGVQMRIPIFSSGLGYHSIQKAKVKELQAQAALNQIEQGARLEYRNARIEFENALEQRRIQRSNLELAERIFDRTQTKYGEGLSSSLELTQVRNQLLTAQGSYINATLQVLNARVRLQKALNNL